MLYNINLASVVRHILHNKSSDAADFSLRHVSSIQSIRNNTNLHSALVDLRLRAVFSTIEDVGLPQSAWSETMDNLLPLDIEEYGLNENDDGTQLLGHIEYRRQQVKITIFYIKNKTLIYSFLFHIL
jgi:hypothetical protein